MTVCNRIFHFNPRYSNLNIIADISNYITRFNQQTSLQARGLRSSPPELTIPHRKR